MQVWLYKDGKMTPVDDDIDWKAEAPDLGVGDEVRDLLYHSGYTEFADFGDEYGFSVQIYGGLSGYAMQDERTRGPKPKYYARFMFNDHDHGLDDVVVEDFANYIMFRREVSLLLLSCVFQRNFIWEEISQTLFERAEKRAGRGKV